MTVEIVTVAILVIVVLGAGGVLTTIGPWYARLQKPGFQPPDWLFAPAWTIIGVLTGWSAVVAWRAPELGHGPGHATTAVLFGLNAVLNILWSGLFFKLRRPDWALGEVVALWASIVLLVAAFASPVPEAAWLLVPYLVWVSFAAFLNLAIVRLNAPFGGGASVPE